MKEQVSIIMVTCNRRVFSQKAIEAVLTNTFYQPHQFIIVDNGSQDGTREYIHQIEPLFPEVLFLSCSRNLGRGKGTNLGLQLAEGEYLVILDDDLVLPEEWLKKMVKALKTVPQVGWLSTNLKEEGVLEESIDNPYVQTFDGIKIETPPGVGGWCIAMKKSVYEKLGALQEDRYYGGIDKEYYQQAINQGLLVGYVQDIVGEHLGGSRREMKYYPEYREYKMEVHHERWFKGKNTLAKQDFFSQREEGLFSHFGNARIKEETFLQRPDGESIYLMTDGKKRELPPRLVHVKHLIKEEIRTCPLRTLEMIPDGETLRVRLYGTKKDHTVYLILGRKKHPISSLEVFYQYGFKAEEIELVEEEALLSFEKGSVL